MKAHWFEEALDGVRGQHPEITVPERFRDAIRYAMPIQGGAVLGKNGKPANYTPGARLEFRLTIREDGEILAAIALQGRSTRYWLDNRLTRQVGLPRPRGDA